MVLIKKISSANVKISNANNANKNVLMVIKLLLTVQLLLEERAQ